MKYSYIIFIAIGVFFVNVFSEAASSNISITPYGLAQYRLRGRIINENFKNGDSAYKQNIYANQIGYYAGFKAKINEQVSFGVQIGNDWVYTEQVTYLTGNHVGKKNSVFPYFHLAYTKWDPGYLNITAGILPENGYGALDLLERSLALGNYGSSQGFGAGQVGWLTGTNGSIAGLKLGVPVLINDFKLGVELLATIVDDSTKARGQALGIDSKGNPSQQLYILDIPISKGTFTITPQFASVLFRKYNIITGKGDHEFDFGFAGSYKINDNFSARANAGYGTFGNSNSHTSNNTDSIEFRRIGILAGAGATFKAGPGNIAVDANYSSDEDTKTAVNSGYSFWFGDFKYIWSTYRNFEITPRVRVFTEVFPDINTTVKSKTEIRPELIFTGKF